MKTIYYLVFTLLIYSPSLNSQITNIEKQRIWSGNSPWHVDSNLNFSYNNNDGNYVYRIAMSAGALFKFRDKKREGLNNKIFLHGNYSLASSEIEDFSNTWFVHLRYNKEISSFFRVETFLQIQENKLLSIRSRNLIGGGIRLKPLQDNKNRSRRNLHLYIGLAYMYEEERSSIYDMNFYNRRASSYITSAFEFGEDGSKLKIVNTIYYQPLLSDFQNFRLSEEFSIAFPISPKIELESTFNYFLNNKTPIGDVEYQSFVGLGFNYSFESPPPPRSNRHIRYFNYFN
jgi:hypothetical protein